MAFNKIGSAAYSASFVDIYKLISFLLFITFSSVISAQSAPTSIIIAEVEPKYLWSARWDWKLPSRTPSDCNYSPEAAAECLREFFDRDPDYAQPITNIRPVELNNSTINGKPVYWVGEIGQVHRATGAVMRVPETHPLFQTGATCPIGSNANTNSTTGNPTIGTVSTLSCGFSRPVDLPKTSCPAVPNPVFVENGLKQQEEIDYQDIKGLLDFKRTWRSDEGRFFNIGQSRLIDYSQPSGCFVGSTYDEFQNIKSYCFPYSSKAIDQIRIVKSNGIIGAYSKFGGALVSRADNNEKLSQKDGSTWELLNEQGAIEAYDLVGLKQRKFIGGSTVTFIYSDINTPLSIAPRTNLLVQMIDNFGRSVHLTYNGFGNIKTLVDPSGKVINYTYNEASGNCSSAFPSDTCQLLTSVTYQDGKTRFYHYNESPNADPIKFQNPSKRFLTGITDENNNRLSSYSYDGHGRVVLSGRGGNDYRLTYNSDVMAVVTDPINTARTYWFTYVLGVKRIELSDQPGGSGCSYASSAITYDANGNVARKTDFNGTVTTYSYDLSRNLETSRVEASGTANARTITTAWHPTYRLPLTISEPLRRTTYTYDSNGNQLSKTIQATSDAMGAQGVSGAAVGAPRTWSNSYNNFGQVLTTTGPRTDLVDVTSYAYDTMGNLISITNALNQVTTLSNYDLNGRVGRITDSNGTVTDMSYSPRGWLTSKSIIAGSTTETTSYSYDGVGQLINVTLPDASSISYTYNPAHRLTNISDSAGNSIVYTLDAMGNRINEQIKDPSGQLARQTTRVVDALNRVQQITGGI